VVDEVMQRPQGDTIPVGAGLCACGKHPPLHIINWEGKPQQNKEEAQPVEERQQQWDFGAPRLLELSESRGCQ